MDITDEEMAYFEHDMDLFVELSDEHWRATSEGREPASFQEVQERVEERRREDRRLEREWKGIQSVPGTLGSH